MRTLNLAIISEEYPPYVWGGIGIHTYNLSNSLSMTGADVTVFCGRSRKIDIVTINDHLRICRLPIPDIPPRFLWFQIQNSSFFNKILPSFDIIHTHADSGSFYGRLKKTINKPWVMSIHSPHPLIQLRTLLHTPLIKWAPSDFFNFIMGYPIYTLLQKGKLKFVDRFVFCGAPALEGYINYENIDKSKYSIIPNGIDFNEISTLTRVYNNENNGANKNFVIFSAGRLMGLKGFEQLILAMPNVLKEHRETILKIFGRGNGEARLRSLISKLNLEQNVKLEGYVPHSTLIRELDKSDVAVFPSLMEVGINIVILEAMACQKPVIAMNFPFLKDTLTHMETGLLVSPSDNRQLSRAICMILSDRKLANKLGANAYRYVRKNHDWTNLSKEYIELYLKLKH